MLLPHLVGELENEMLRALLALPHMINTATRSTPGPETTSAVMIGRTLAGQSAIRTVEKALEVPAAAPSTGASGSNGCSATSRQRGSIRSRRRYSSAIPVASRSAWISTGSGRGRTGRQESPAGDRD
jgi:hypothetical protein